MNIESTASADRRTPLGQSTAPSRQSRSKLRRLAGALPIVVLVPALALPAGGVSAKTAPPAPAPNEAAAVTLPGKAYVVSTGGKDTNSGAPSAPWRTLQKAANSAPAGATIYVRAGTYTGFTMTRSGTSTAPITFTRYPGDARPTVAGNGRVDVIKFTANHDVKIYGLTILGAAGGKGSGAGIRTENGAYRISIVNNIIRNNHSYGININNSKSVLVQSNDINNNEEGVYISRAGAGVKVINNRVHHQNKMVVNTSGTAHDDHGAVGIAFVRTVGPVLVSGNKLWANRARSHDYGWDGGAFEIYAASGVTIEKNTTWDNEMVLETGTDSGMACAGNSFRRNVSYGATSSGRSYGLHLRCGANMVVANNVFHRLDEFVFAVGGSSRYNGAFNGLRIQNNIASMASGKIFGIEANVPSSLVINNNLVEIGNGYLATVVGKGGTKSQSTFTSWTGYQRNGIVASPRFVNAGARDYRIASGSPAIDRAAVLKGVSDTYNGAGPDIGRFER